MQGDIRKVSDCVWEQPCRGGMRVPARIYASEKLLNKALADNALQQVVNVAHLPGIVSDVVDTCSIAGISRKVAKLKPVGCMKG